jgi:hypothetical protein
MEDLFQRYFWPSVRRVSGVSDGVPASVTLIGDRPSTRYFVNRFLDESTEEESLGVMPAAQFISKINRYCDESDLVVGRIAAPFSRTMSRLSACAAPLMVQPKLSLPLSEERAAAIRKRQRDNVRKIRKNGLSYQISTDPIDCEYFIDHIYLPFVKRRFGGLAGIMPRAKMQRYFRDGGVMWIMRDGERVAGELFARMGHRLKSVSSGTLEGREDLVEAGALSATYYYMTEWASEEGFTLLDWGGCDPTLASGVLTTKKRWGADLHCDSFQRFEILFAWKSFGPKIRAFLNHTPLILHHGKQLVGLGATPSEDPASPKDLQKLANRFWIPGLSRLYIVGGEGAALEAGRQGDDSDRIWLAEPGTPKECLQSAVPLRETGGS